MNSKYQNFGSRKNKLTFSEEIRDPRANLGPLFASKLLKVATRRSFLSCLGIFGPNFWNFLKLFMDVSFEIHEEDARMVLAAATTKNTSSNQNEFVETEEKITNNSKINSTEVG